MGFDSSWEAAETHGHVGIPCQPPGHCTFQLLPATGLSHCSGFETRHPFHLTLLGYIYFFFSLSTLFSHYPPHWDHPLEGDGCTTEGTPGELVRIQTPGPALPQLPLRGEQSSPNPQHMPHDPKYPLTVPTASKATMCPANPASTASSSALNQGHSTSSSWC